MFNNLSRAKVAGMWCAAVLVLAAFGVVAGVPLTLGNGALLLVVGLTPPAVMLAVWRGAPPQTVAELLHSADESPKDTRP
jgi:hypothetical protein